METACRQTDGLGLQNAADLSKLIGWNKKYGIIFLRISSEMLPFASHKYGYSLDFSKDVLVEARRLRVWRQGGHARPLS